MDPNTTSAAYNPQIIEARKATLAEKLRRAIGLRRGVEESVPEERTILSAKLRLRELADISIGTAKKVLREIRAGNPGLRIFRPESSPMMAQYISPHTPKKMIKAAQEQLVNFQPNGRDFKLAPNSMIVPRDVARRDPDLKEHVEDMKKMVLSSIPKKLVPIQQAAYKKAESLNSPVGMALHEAGHATMPESVSKNISKLQQAAAKNGGISMTDPYFKTGIDEEYRANREVLNKIKQHGTPQEADSWRKRSQDQIKIGYRAPVFYDALMQEASPEELQKAMTGGSTPLSLKRRVLQKYPHIRKQQLSAKLRLRELARQASYDPYAVQAQPAEPGQAGRDFRNAALGIGALGAGGGVAYAGFRGAQAAKSAQVLTDDALKTSGEARKAARSARVAAARVNRAGKVIKTQLTTFPTFKKVASKIFEEDLQSLKELADRSVELNSITYHETNADILRRKARGHREKRDESTGMWPYAVAAPGILAASPALRAESSGRVASLGKKLWKGEHADNTAHIGNKVAGILRAHPGKVVSALALAPAAVLGGNLAYHTIAARSKDSGVNKELKLANEMRRQRNAEALKKS